MSAKGTNNFSWMILYLVMSGFFQNRFGFQVDYNKRTIERIKGGFQIVRPTQVAVMGSPMLTDTHRWPKLVQYCIRLIDFVSIGCFWCSLTPLIRHVYKQQRQWHTGCVFQIWSKMRVVQEPTSSILELLTFGGWPWIARWSVISMTFYCFYRKNDSIIFGQNIRSLDTVGIVNTFTNVYG